ncbi:GNAT family N-acetyltransferase [bacterium]|nr:GNAT family N-acetyltransferase [bacterium]
MNGTSPIEETISIRPARAQEAPAIAPLVFASGPRVYRRMMRGDDAIAVERLSRLIARAGHLLGHQNILVASIGRDAIRGAALVYDARQEKREGMRLVREIARVMPATSFGASLAFMLAMTRVTASIADGALYLAAFGVAPDMRGRGIGARLIDAMRDAAIKRGLSLLEADVDIDNERAMAFYRRLGFEIAKTKPAGLLRPMLGFPGHHRVRVRADDIRAERQM